MPIACLYEGMQVATAIFSYLGGINFGYIADRSAFPDLPRLGECMEESFAELLDIARASQAPTAEAPRPAARRKVAKGKPAVKKATGKKTASGRATGTGRRSAMGGASSGRRATA